MKDNDDTYNEEFPNDWATAFNAGAALSERKEFEINETPAVLIPDGYKVQTFEEHRERPIRIERCVATHTARAFVKYVKRFWDDGTMVFADGSKATFTAVIDYHRSADVPDWCRHSVTYACPTSREWDAWMKSSGKVMTQAQFAEFIEDNLVDIVQPVGAEMLEVAKTLDARTSVRFKSGIRLDNGETQLVYEEMIDGAAGAKGQIKIPQTIKLALRVFQGEDPYEVEARFKYRIKEGALTMWQELVRPERITEDAFRGILERIAEELDLVPVIEAAA
jgi:uncharacterized protein YfdQ (DUF2303 family)